MGIMLERTGKRQIDPYIIFFTSPSLSNEGLILSTIWGLNGLIPNPFYDFIEGIITRILKQDLVFLHDFLLLYGMKQ